MFGWVRIQDFPDKTHQRFGIIQKDNVSCIGHIFQISVQFDQDHPLNQVMNSSSNL
jgi:hypothetical protein